MNALQIQELLDIAINAARKASKFIQDFPRKDLEISSKPGASSIASEVVTQVDVMVQGIILEILKSSIDKYHLGVLAEEKEDDFSRLSKAYFWSIDPIDGTLAFTRNTRGYSISIALIAQNGEPIIAVVCDPCSGDLYTAAKGYGASKNSQILKIENKRYPTFICDPTFVYSSNYLPKIEEFKKEHLKKDEKEIGIINIGGAVMNAIWAIENAPAIYSKPPKEKKGGGCIWDYAATACIYKELGLEVSDFKRNPLNFNSKETIYFNHCGIRYSTLN